MSMRMVDAVRQRSRAKGTALNVLLFLAWYANDEGVAWPSQATLARDANVTERRVRDALAQLVALGEIVRVVRGRRATVTWQISLSAAVKPGSPAPDLTASKPGSPAPDLTAPKSGSPAPDLSSNPEAERSNPEAERRKSGGQLPPNLQEPTIEPLEAAAAEQAAFDLWNELARSCDLKPVTRLTAGRREKLAARLAECGYDGWTIALQKVALTPGLLGAADSGWRISFDWLVDEHNFAKVTEDAYANWDPTAPRPSNGHGLHDDHRSRTLDAFGEAARRVRERRGGAA